jgi:hypothetical protein
VPNAIAEKSRNEPTALKIASMEGILQIYSLTEMASLTRNSSVKLMDGLLNDAAGCLSRRASGECEDYDVS